MKGTVLTNIPVSTASCQCLAPVVPNFTHPHIVKFELRDILYEGSEQCNVIKSCCTVASKNTGMTFVDVIKKSFSFPFFFLLFFLIDMNVVLSQNVFIYIFFILIFCVYSLMLYVGPEV